MITENEIIEILESNILPQFKDIIGIFKDDWIDKRKPIFKKIAKTILDKIKDRNIDKESEIRRETKTYEEESGLLEEDKI